MNRKTLIQIAVFSSLTLLIIIGTFIWVVLNPTGKIKVSSPTDIQTVQIDGKDKELSSAKEITLKPGEYRLTAKAKDSDAAASSQAVVVSKDQTTEVTVIFAPDYDDSSDPDLTTE